MFRHCPALKAPRFGAKVTVVPAGMAADTSWLSVTRPVDESIVTTVVPAGMPVPETLMPALTPAVDAGNCKVKFPAVAATVVVAVTAAPGSILRICCTAFSSASNGGGEPSPANWNGNGLAAVGGAG